MIKQSDLVNVAWPPAVKEVRAQVARIGLTQAETAALLRVDPRTMRSYLSEANGKNAASSIPFAAYALLREIKPNG